MQKYKLLYRYQLLVYTNYEMVRWLIVLLLVRMVHIHTSALSPTILHCVTVVGTGMSHGCVHTRPVWLTQNGVALPSTLGPIVVTDVIRRTVVGVLMCCK